MCAKTTFLAKEFSRKVWVAQNVGLDLPPTLSPPSTLGKKTGSSARSLVFNIFKNNFLQDSFFAHAPTHTHTVISLSLTHLSLSFPLSLPLYFPLFPLFCLIPFSILLIRTLTSLSFVSNLSLVFFAPASTVATNVPSERGGGILRNRG